MYDKIKIPYPALFGIVLTSFLLGALVCDTIITIVKPERMQVEVVMKAPKDVLQTAHFTPDNDEVIPAREEAKVRRIKSNESTRRINDNEGDLAKRIYGKNINSNSSTLEDTPNIEIDKGHSLLSDTIPKNSDAAPFNDDEIEKLRLLLNTQTK